MSGDAPSPPREDQADGAERAPGPLRSRAARAQPGAPAAAVATAGNAPDSSPCARRAAGTAAGPFFAAADRPEPIDFGEPATNGPVAAGGGANDPSKRATRLLAGMLAAAVALALAGLLWWRLVPDAPPPPPLPQPGAAPAGATTLEDAVAIAQAQADRWLPGARLLNATMQVDWPWRVPGGRVTDLPATGWVTAVFLAPWDAPPGRAETAASLSVVLERLSRQIVLQETLGWETAAQPAATPTPGIDSTVASILAERAGGTAFRRACPELRHLSRIGLVSNAPGYPQHWLVTYEDSRAPESRGLLLRIDATTGAVVGREQDAPSCPGAAPAG